MQKDENDLIGDNEFPEEIYEISKILKRCKNLDYWTEYNKEDGYTFVSLETGLDVIATIIVDIDSDELYVSYNMKNDPRTTIELHVLMYEIANHIDRFIIVGESFITVIEDEKLITLYGDEVIEELGFEPIMWE